MRSIAQKCKVDGCHRKGYLRNNGKRYFIKGLCCAHYQRQRFGKSLSNDSFDYRPAVISGDIAMIPLGPRAKDGYAIVDKEYSWLDKHHWSISGGYAYTNSVERNFRNMHRLIIGAKKGEIVDHINRDRLDNRKSNLRICTSLDNALNKSPYGKHGYKGIAEVYGGKWKAQLSFKGKRYYSRTYLTKEEAAAAYDKMATDYFGEFAVLNFHKK